MILLVYMLGFAAGIVAATDSLWASLVGIPVVWMYLAGVARI